MTRIGKTEGAATGDRREDLPRRDAKGRLFTTTRGPTVESFTLLTPGYRGNRPSDIRLAEQSANGAQKNGEAGAR